MPHSTLKLIPGVDENRTMALNEAALSYSNLIRFVPDRQGLGLPQKLGGWTQYGSVTGTPRALLAWEDMNYVKRLAVGCQTTGNATIGAPLYVLTNGVVAPITPQCDTHNVAVAVSTTSGSNVVTITDTGSNITSFDAVFIKTHISIGGLILFGFYDCVFLSANQYQIYATDVLGNPAPATSTASGGTVASFATTNGSNTVTVTLANHGYVV